jgi:hypothetical protein
MLRFRRLGSGLGKARVRRMTSTHKALVFGVAASLLPGSGILCAGGPAQATSSKPGLLRPFQQQLSGRILGNVRNTLGVVQMGATVYLYNRYDQVVRQALTNENGQFLFDSLAPDLYSVRVALSSFVPAMKRGVGVAAGVESVLNVNLASVLSTIELVRATPGQALMSDDWKWALRSAPGTRPAMRMLPGIDIGTTRSSSVSTPIFSEVRGLFDVSAGDPGEMGSVGTQADLGTSFAVATSLYDANKLHFSGNFGIVPHSGLPAAGFSTTYSRESTNGWSSPEVTLSAHQLFMSDRTGTNNMPALRTMSLSSIDRVTIGDAVKIEYGVSIDSIQLVDRLTFVSPFARMTYTMGGAGAMQIGFSSGAPPIGLFNTQASGGEHDSELRRDLAVLSVLPRLSLSGGHLRMQRNTNFEVGYSKVVGKTTFHGAAYQEQISNAGVQMSAPNDLFVGEVLPDLGSKASMFDAGNLNRWGFMASATHPFGDRFEGTLAMGRGGVLTAVDRETPIQSTDQLRADLKSGERTWATAGFKATMPRTGTRITSSYSWTDYSVMMPGHLFLTEQAFPETGLNIGLKQPIPGLFGMPGRLELSLDTRNMLAQGYLPLRTADGRQFLLIQSPRALRGGLSFIF